MAQHDSGFMSEGQTTSTESRLYSPQSEWFTNGLPANTAALYETILDSTPTELANEDRYREATRMIAPLPVLGKGLRRYQDEFKPAILAELQAGISHVVSNPDKQERPIATQKVRLLDQESRSFPTTISTCLVRVNTDEIKFARPMDLVVLSEFEDPFLQERGSCVCGIVKNVDRHTRVKPKQEKQEDERFLHIEINQSRVEGLMSTFAVNGLYLTVVASLASPLRMFMGLEGPTMPVYLQEMITREFVLPVEKESSVNLTSAGLIDKVSHFTKNPLNPSQQRAVIEGLRYFTESIRPPLMIVGPPGCGKTHTLISMLLAIMVGYPSQTIHVTAPSNPATIEIALRLTEAVKMTPQLNLFLSRICLVAKEEAVEGNSALEMISSDFRMERLKDIVWKWEQVMADLRTFENLSTDPEQEPTAASTQSLTHERRVKDCMNALAVIYTLRYDLDDVFSGYREQLDTSASLLRKWIDRNPFPRAESPEGIVEVKLAYERLEGPPWKLMLARTNWSQKAVGRATVFFSTVNGAARGVLREVVKRKRLVIVDEATQTSEAEINILLRGTLYGPVLIGDEKQLSSTVLCASLFRKGFGVSLFERLKHSGMTCHTLDVQFRMDPQIADWPSRTFYQGRIKNGLNVTSPARIPTWQRLSRVFQEPYQIIDVPGEEKSDVATRSTSNPKEAAVACALVEELARTLDNANESSLSVGCVAGYLAQVHLIASKLRNRSNSSPSEEQDYSNSARVMYKTPKQKLILIDIASIDGFQGQERDVIILTNTRSNDGGNLGFMADPRRLNVALTRAKFVLRVLVNVSTIGKAKSIWNLLLEDANQRSVLRSAPALHPDLFSVAEVAALKLMRKTIKIATTTMAEATSVVPLPATGREKTELIPHEALRASEIVMEDLGLVWKVFMSSHAKRALETGTQNMAKDFVTVLKGLAMGFKKIHAKREAIDVNGTPYIFQYPIGDSWIYWSVKAFPSVLARDQATEDFAYTQGLWFWAIGNEQSRKRDLTSIQQLAGRVDSQYQAFCSEWEWNSDKRAVPKIKTFAQELKEYKSFSRIQAEAREAEATALALEDSLAPIDEMDLIKGFMVDQRVSDSAISGVLASLTLPYVLSAAESRLVYSHQPSFILGRSGTGKTTVMVLKIYARHLAAGNSGCKQILITASGHLVLGIQQHFASLTSSSGAGVTPGLLSYHGDATFDEEATVPFQDIPTTEFPLFYTLGKLLRVLDISLPGEKFPGFRFDGTKRSREVDFARFATHYYRHLPLWIQKRFEHGGSTVYSEIMSVIKGSAKSVLMGRPLTRKEYLRIDARDSELSDVDRENVYVAYTAYKERLASLGEWDVCDALLCLHQRLQANPRAVPDFAVESLNVDEVQDWTESALLLLRCFLSGRNSHLGILYGGDTAQTIASGVNFKFSALRRLVYEHYLPHCRATDPILDAKMKAHPGEEGLLVPPIRCLTTNYRSSAKIVELGAAVVEMIQMLFAGGIDVLEKETGLVEGSRPLAFATKDVGAFLTAVYGSDQTEQIEGEESAVGLGAGQVVICRNAEGKARAKEVVQNAICLTVLEAKGLEYDDVVLFDFVRDSLFQRWHIFRGSDLEQAFDAQKDSSLQTELKMLYVCVTRARSNLWIFDSGPQSDYLHSFLARANLVTLLDKQPVASLAKKSSLQEWRAEGWRYMERRAFGEALFCFERSLDQDLADQARAHLLWEAALAEEGADRKDAAAIKFLEAGEAFCLIHRFFSAGECFGAAAEHTGRGKDYLRAARCFRKCPERPMASRLMLQCYVKLPEYIDEALESMRAEWIIRDDFFNTSIKDFIYILHDQNRMDDIAEASKLLAASDERITLLETLGLHDLVVSELLSLGSHSHLAKIYESRAQLDKATEQHGLAGDTARADFLRSASERARQAKPMMISLSSLARYLQVDTLHGQIVIPKIHLPLHKIVTVETLMTGEDRLGMVHAVTTAIPGPMDRKPTGQSSDATWSLIETLNEISTRFLDHRRSLANFRDLESYGKLLFGTIDGLGGGSETFISRAILELLANNKTRQDEKGEWVEIHETDLRAYARRLMDEIYHCGTESITQSTRDALEWARWCYEAMLKSPKCEDLDENTGCRNSHDVAFLKEHRIRRLNALGHMIQLYSRWPATAGRSQTSDSAFDHALDFLLQDELFPTNLVISDARTTHKWLKQPIGRDTCTAIIDTLRSRPTGCSLQTALHIAQMSTITQNLVFPTTGNIGHKALEEALLLSRLQSMPEGPNPLYSAAIKVSRIFVDPVFWPQNGSAQSRIFVMEKACCWIAILMGRLYHLVLPERLIQSELCQASKAAVGHLIERDTQKRLIRRQNYHLDPLLVGNRDRLFKGISDRLRDPDSMFAFASTESHGERIAITVRLILCGAILTINARKPERGQAQTDRGWRSFRSYAKMLKLLVKDPRFSGLPDEVNSISQLDKYAPRQELCALLCQLSSTVCDPMLLIIDPASRMRGPDLPTPHSDLADFPLVLAGRSEHDGCVVLGRTLAELNTAKVEGVGWQPYDTDSRSITLSAAAPPFTPQTADQVKVDDDGKAVDPQDIKAQEIDEGGSEAGSADGGEEEEEIVLQDIVVKQESVPDLPLGPFVKQAFERWGSIMRHESRVIDLMTDELERHRESAIRDLRRARIQPSLASIRYLKICIPALLEVRRVILQAQQFTSFWNKAPKPKPTFVNATKAGSPSKHAADIATGTKKLIAMEVELALDRLISKEGLNLEKVTAGAEALGKATDLMEREYGGIFKAYQKHREKVAPAAK